MTDRNQRLTRNAAQCLDCMDIIESKHRHDYVRCSCGNIAVDGGLSYIRRTYKDYAKFKNLSEYTTIEPTNLPTNNNDLTD